MKKLRYPEHIPRGLEFMAPNQWMDPSISYQVHNQHPKEIICFQQLNIFTKDLIAMPMLCLYLAAAEQTNTSQVVIDVCRTSRDQTLYIVPSSTLHSYKMMNSRLPMMKK
jgi:hypothetical protein